MNLLYIARSVFDFGCDNKTISFNDRTKSLMRISLLMRISIQINAKLN